ncbi:MAG: PRC-barrel domain-containing protein [Candidatus Aquicultorales bacterium]
MVLWVHGSERLPVFNCWSGKYYGRITEFFVDDSFTKVLGFAFRTRIFRPRWALDFSAVRLANDDLLLVENKGKRWLPMNKALHYAWKKSKGRPPIKAIEDGEVVGEVTDFAFDCETGLVKGFTVSRSLLGKLTYVSMSDMELSGSDSIVVRQGVVNRKKEEKPSGGLLNGFLVGAAKSLGKGVARAKAEINERSAGSLEGKDAPGDITDRAGNVIVKEGETLTKEKLDELKGSDKISEASLLMMGKSFGGALARANRRLKKLT